MQLHRLEAPGQCRVFLEVFLVLAPGRCSDGAQLAACQGRLEQIGRIAAAGLAAGANQRVRLVDEQDDRLRRALHFVDHTLQPAFEFALHTCAGLQQAEVQAEQLDALECRRHFAAGDAQGQAFDDGGLADPGLADHDRIVLSPPGEDVDHLADRRVAAEHRIELAVAGLLGEVVGKARQVGFATGWLLAVRGLRLLTEGEVAQALGVQPGQQWLVMTAGIAQRIAQQRENQRGLVDLALAEFQAGHQQGILQPLHQFGGKHRVTRLAVLASRLQRLRQCAGIHFGIQQGSLEQSIGTLEQAKQQVLDENLAAATYHAAFGGAFQIALGLGVQRLHQLLQIDIDHFHLP